MSFAADLLRAEGDVVVIPLALAKKIGLQAAAFLRQAAYLSAIVESKDGWFFLEQEGEGDPIEAKIFKRLGSWQACLGIGPDAQVAIRKKLGKDGLGLLEETRKGMVFGRLLYRVDSQKYLEFLASCTPVCPCSDGQPEIPDCTTSKPGLNKRQKPEVIYQVDALGLKIPPPIPPVGGKGGGGFDADDQKAKTVFSDEELDEFGRSAVWNGGEKVGDALAYAMVAIKRIVAHGASQTDLAQRDRYRASLAQDEAERKVKAEAEARTALVAEEQAALAAIKQAAFARFESQTVAIQEAIKKNFVLYVENPSNKLSYLMEDLRRKGVDGTHAIRCAFQKWLCSQTF